MDRSLKVLTIFIAAAYLILLFRGAELMLFRADEIRSHPANKRLFLEQINAERGKIISADGKILAESVRKDGRMKRVYQYGPVFAHITGYFSDKYGLYGAENSFNDLLSSNPSDIFWSGKPKPPENITLSLDSRLQKKAYSLLKQKGAICAIDVKSGQILAMVSYPAFDPNEIDRNFEKLRSDKEYPLINRATQGFYTPGSTLKIITLAAYLENGGSLDDRFDAPAELKLSGFRITNFEGQAYGKPNVKLAFAKSINTVFAQIALKIGSENFKESLEIFGIEDATGIELPEKPGKITGDLSDPVNLAWSAVGQAEMSVSPLQILMAATTVARKGIYIAPTITANRSNIKERRVIAEDTAEKIKDAMVACVEAGTGKAAKLSGIKVAGKTGTAEVEGKKPHAWFVGFAPADDPEIACVVVLENAGTGGRYAAPLFKELIAEYFSHR